MANKAKDCFESAKTYTDAAKNPGMFNLLAGLIFLAEQIEDVQFEIRQLKSGVEELRKRSP